MKRRNLIITGIIIAAVLVSCEALIGTFSASINGTLWEANTILAVKNSNSYTITATKSSSTLFMTVNGTSTGTYVIDPNDTTFEAFVYTPDITMSSVSYAANQGSINLTKVEDNRLTGTFDVYVKNVNDPLDSLPITGQFSNLLTN